MPSEYELIKNSDDKKLPDSEFEKVRAEYNKKAEESGNKVKKTIFIFMGILAVNFAVINLIALLNSEANFGNGLGNYTWLSVEFIVLALFLYDPKAEEDKRYKYETSQKIILKSLENKIKLNKIRFGCVIGFAVIFLLLNILAWWLIIFNMTSAAAGF